VSILDVYTHEPPSISNALELFAGQWSSKLPGELGVLGPGPVPLFEDNRIDWLVAQLGGIEGFDVLELGPLEAGHSYMLEQAGAAHITAIEANSRAFMRCLLVKEIVGLSRTSFLYGDFVPWLKANDTHYDLTLASGVLYHMVDPAGFLADMARSSDRVFIWTQYHDAEIIGASPRLAAKFPSHEVATIDGVSYTKHRYEYEAALSLAGFCGGNQPHSTWLGRDDILTLLAHFGLTEISIAFEEPDHPNGPAFSLLAQRPAGSAADRSTRADDHHDVASLEVPSATINRDLVGTVAYLRVTLQQTQAELAAMRATKTWRARAKTVALRNRVLRRPT
jgi:hypothetical protein